MDTYDLQIYKGQTFLLSLTLKDDNDLAIDLTNTAISGYLKNRYSDPLKMENLNTAIVSPTSGTVSLSLSATATANLPTNIGVYDVEMFNLLDGSTTKILCGKAYIYPETTY